jgi:hypothetical protein
MGESFIVYIDESGDEGFSFNKGSSNWFILSAVVTHKTSDLEVVKLVDQVKALLKWQSPKKPLHFRDLKHHQRIPFVDHIAKSDLRTVSILVHKPSIREPETFHTRYRLYFYAVRLLFERVSWYCRDHRVPNDSGDGSARIIFSNRAGMSYEEMVDYMEILKQSPREVRIEWDVINTTQIEAYTAGRRMGLQIADAVASSFFYGLEPSEYGYIEERYARMLKPVVYSRKGKYQGYGLKVWPPEVTPLLMGGENYKWIQNEYK